jgi:hypothetical protein
LLADTAPIREGCVELSARNATERGWMADPMSIPGRPFLGFGRPVPFGDRVAALAPSRWRRTSDGGHLVSVRLRSPGAPGLRIALKVAALPDAALLGFFEAAGEMAAVLSGAKSNATHAPF